jgi:hypothetical protein
VDSGDLNGEKQLPCQDVKEEQSRRRQQQEQRSSDAANSCREQEKAYHTLETGDKGP